MSKAPVNSRVTQFAVCLGLAFACLSVQAADIRIINLDNEGEGLNDTTARAPTGGNNGNTIGEQRLIALRFVADLLGDRLSSIVPIRVGTNFDPQPCEPNSASLGIAAPTLLVSDFPGAELDQIGYPIALANAMAGQDLDESGPDVSAVFNSTLDADTPEAQRCLGGADWYYGLDDNPPPGQLSFISTATHELIHGLGFFSSVILEDDPTTPQDEIGRFPGDNGDRLPDIFSVFVLDLTRGVTWRDLSASGRADSARNDGNLVWNGSSTTSQGAPTLTAGTNNGRVQLFAPTTLMPGSSVAHWDVDLQPTALMEPFETFDNRVTEGIGLASCLLEDIGWRLLGNTRCPDRQGTGGPPDGGDSGDDGGIVSGAGDNSGGAGAGSVINDGESGGGCTLASGGLPDPTLLLLVALAWLVVIGRRFRWIP